jgi:hypothetical protein
MEPDGVGRRVCRGQALSSGLLLRQADGRYLLWVTRPDPKDAEKSEWRMALKI